MTSPAATMGLHGLAHLSLRDQVRRAVVEAILIGQLPAGERINETDVATKLGVSQTPVREALLGLEGEGFVESRSGRGFFVRHFSIQEASESYLLLARLETLALQLSGIPDAGTLDELRAINRDFANCGPDTQDALRLDSRFHDTLLERCPNHLLLRLIERVRRIAHRYESAYMRELSNRSPSVKQHDAILDHLAIGSLEAACQPLEANWIDGSKVAVEWLTNHELKGKTP